MRGRGFSSCLICEDYSGLVLGSKILNQFIKDLYSDHDHEVMLASTRFCFGCVGRFQQLHQFWTRKHAMKGNAIENAEETCKFCYREYEKNGLVQEDVQHDVRLLIMKMKFREEFANGEQIICCYACSNFLALYDEFKSLLMERSEYFYRALTSCSVNLNKNPQVKQEKEDVEAVQSISLSAHNSPSTSPIDEGYQEQSMSPTTEENYQEQEQIPVEENFQEQERNSMEEEVQIEAPVAEEPIEPPAVEEEVLIEAPIANEQIEPPAVEACQNSSEFIELPQDVQYEIEIPHSQADQENESTFVTPTRDLRSRSKSNGVEIENILKAPKSNSRVRSSSSARVELQDINDNIVANSKRPRRESLLPSIRKMSIEEPKKVESPGSTSKGRKKATLSRKKLKYSHPVVTPEDQELLDEFNILPCAVHVERLPIQSPGKQNASKSVRKGNSKGQLKIRLTPKSDRKRKSQSKDTQQPSTKKSKQEEPSEEFDSYVRLQSQLLRSPGLIITEDLQEEVITEEYSEEFDNYQATNDDVEEFNGFPAVPKIEPPKIIQHITDIEFLDPSRQREITEGDQMESRLVEAEVKVKVEPVEESLIIIETPKRGKRQMKISSFMVKLPETPNSAP